MSFVQGTVVRLTAELHDTLTGNLQDMSTLEVNVRRPSGALDKYTTATGIVKDSTGKYHCDVDTDPESGTWHYEWDTRGPGAVVGRDQLLVRPRVGAESP